MNTSTSPLSASAWKTFVFMDAAGYRIEPLEAIASQLRASSPARQQFLANQAPLRRMVEQLHAQQRVRASFATPGAVLEALEGIARAFSSEDELATLEPAASGVRATGGREGSGHSAPAAAAPAPGPGPAERRLLAQLEADARELAEAEERATSPRWATSLADRQRRLLAGGRELARVVWNGNASLRAEFVDFETYWAATGAGYRERVKSECRDGGARIAGTPGDPARPENQRFVAEFASSVALREEFANDVAAYVAVRRSEEGMVGFAPAGAR